MRPALRSSAPAQRHTAVKWRRPHETWVWMSPKSPLSMSRSSWSVTRLFLFPWGTSWSGSSLSFLNYSMRGEDTEAQRTWPLGSLLCQTPVLITAKPHFLEIEILGKTWAHSFCGQRHLLCIKEWCLTQDSSGPLGRVANGPDVHVGVMLIMLWLGPVQ